MNTVLVVLDWLSLGVLVGVGLSALVAGTFVLGRRLFPDPPMRPGASEDTESRRRTEIRTFLALIEEPFAENHLVEGHSVDFYLPKRDVAITFDPRAFLAIDIDGDGRTYPILVEHELPGSGLGGRLPFETPDIGTDEDEKRTSDGRFLAPDPAAFAHLGLPTSASEEEIRRAYRRRVKAVHPDQGGDPEAFRQLQEAYVAAREQTA